MNYIMKNFKLFFIIFILLLLLFYLLNNNSNNININSNNINNTNNKKIPLSNILIYHKLKVDNNIKKIIWYNNKIKNHIIPENGLFEIILLLTKSCIKNYNDPKIIYYEEYDKNNKLINKKYTKININL